jgi:CubicO group peptidase (beta-lactamase class C family)
MIGAFVKSGNNNVFYSTARSAARFGLFSLANGYWDGKEILKNQDYISKMKNSSQNINPSYGYLWWLNGKGKVMLPGSQLMLNRDLNRYAPKDMYAALGKNDQKIYVIPSENLVVVRLGELGTLNDIPVPIIYDEYLWQRLSSIMNLTTSTKDNYFIDNNAYKVTVDQDYIIISGENNVTNLTLYDSKGSIVSKAQNSRQLDISHLQSGIYFLSISDHQSNVKLSKLFLP